MSLRTGERYRFDALVRAGVESGQRALDVACGTGVMARHLRDLVGARGSVLALDPSLPMLREAVRRGVEQRVAGIAERLPLPDESVDFVSMGYALRHVADLRVAFDEFRRVLRPGGGLLILEMVPPRSRLGYQLTKLYLKYLVPGVTSLVTGSADARKLMRYYWDTVDRCVSPELVMSTLEKCGFESVERSIQMGIMNEYRATRSNAEQTSKRTMHRPTRTPIRGGLIGLGK
jgi:demethylmenaquinone methyltransferase/2-methoxy-6-polyprenyl-1,4-benzoquinol methylase